RTVKYRGQPVGKVHLLADTTEWSNTLWDYAAVAAVLFVVVLTIGLFVSIWLQRLITGPIIDLAQLARRIGQERDFSRRAVKRSDDERVVLVEELKDILAEIAKAPPEIEHGG